MNCGDRSKASKASKVQCQGPDLLLATSDSPAANLGTEAPPMVTMTKKPIAGDEKPRRFWKRKLRAAALLTAMIPIIFSLPMSSPKSDV